MDDSRLWSVAAEAAVLGSMIIDTDCISKVLPILPSEEAFFRLENQLIYAALLRLYANRNPTDAIMLRDELESVSELDRVGGVEYIGEVMNSVPSSATAEYYAKIVRDKQRYRNLITNVEQMQQAIDEPVPVDEQVQKIQDIALGLKADRPETEFFTLSDHAIKVAEQAEGQQEIIPTGFDNIDQKIQGLSPGDLCVIAGRPSMGKSTLALDIAIKMAKTGKSILFFTLEMPHKGLIERAIVSTGKVTMPRIRQGLTDYETDRAKDAARGLENLDVGFHEGATTPEKQIAFIRTRKKIHKVDVVIVDYLQLMNTAGRKTENRVQEISVISRELKLAALQENIPIIALSQLNRAVEARQSHRPRMSDLRDSGSIEQDADFVLLLHREDYYRRSESPDTENVDGVAEVIIAKARNCKPGIAHLVFLEEQMKFVNRR